MYKNEEKKREYNRRYKKEHKEQINAYNKVYKKTKKGIEVAKNYAKNYYSSHKEKYQKIHWRKASYKKNYGITPEQADDLFSKQNYKCAICGKSLIGLNRLGKGCIDHNHKTKKVRGILCRSCNNGLSWLENEEFMRKAVLYLGR